VTVTHARTVETWARRPEEELKISLTLVERSKSEIGAS